MAKPRYRGEHPRIRAHIQAQLQAGHTIHCTNPHCQHPGVPVSPIPGTPLSLQLGHNPDRTTHRGPEHAICNGSEGGTIGANITNGKRVTTRQTWGW